MATTLSRTFGNQTLTFETGKLAKQAGGSCVVTYGETQVLATCTTSAREGIDFPAHDRRRGADVRGREDPRRLLPAQGRLSETAILTAPTDRPMRPSFGRLPTRSRSSSPCSADMANPHDIAG
jgi:polyribonucleotide nucleotidyltransferase